MFLPQNKEISYKSQKNYSISHKASALLGCNCQLCESRRHVDTHHIDGNRKNNPKSGSNWLKVCRRCHHRLHSKIRDSKGRFAGNGALLAPHLLLARLRQQLRFQF